jgi:hypothetical protein
MFSIEFPVALRYLHVILLIQGLARNPIPRVESGETPYRYY